MSRDNLADRLRRVAEDVEHYIEDDHDVTLGMPVQPEDIGAMIDTCRLMAGALDQSLADHLESSASYRVGVSYRAVQGKRSR